MRAGAARGQASRQRRAFSTTPRNPGRRRTAPCPAQTPQRPAPSEGLHRASFAAALPFPSPSRLPSGSSSGRRSSRFSQQSAPAVRIPRKMGIDSTASWAAIPRLGQSGRLVHGVRLGRSGQAVSEWPRASACSRRQGATGGRCGRAGRGLHRPGSDRRWPRASARPEAGW